MDETDSTIFSNPDAIRLAAEQQQKMGQGQQQQLQHEQSTDAKLSVSESNKQRERSNSACEVCKTHPPEGNHTSSPFLSTSLIVTNQLNNRDPTKPMKQQFPMQMRRKSSATSIGQRTWYQHTDGHHPMEDGKERSKFYSPAAANYFERRRSQQNYSSQDPQQPEKLSPSCSSTSGNNLKSTRKASGIESMLRRSCSDVLALIRDGPLSSAGNLFQRQHRSSIVSAFQPRPRSPSTFENANQSQTKCITLSPPPIVYGGLSTAPSSPTWGRPLPEGTMVNSRSFSGSTYLQQHRRSVMITPRGSFLVTQTPMEFRESSLSINYPNCGGKPSPIFSIYFNYKITILHVVCDHLVLVRVEIKKLLTFLLTYVSVVSYTYILTILPLQINDSFVIVRFTIASMSCHVVLHPCHASMS